MCRDQGCIGDSSFARVNIVLSIGEGLQTRRQHQRVDTFAALMSRDREAMEKAELRPES